MERYDIAIIGTGPAGVSAAITAKIRGRKILLIGNNKISDKVSKAHIIKNYPGFIDITGKELSQAFNNHLKSLSIDITEDMVNAVYAMGKYFHIQGKKNNYEALTVILATGVDVTKPYAGEYENLGRGVSYCATCDAALYKEREAIVIGFNEESLSEKENRCQLSVGRIKWFLLWRTENLRQTERYKIKKLCITSGLDKTDVIHSFCSNIKY